MEKVYTRIIVFLVFITALGSMPVFGQTITVRPVDPGPYGRSSSIGVSFGLTYADKNQVFDQTNVFRLFLSDANGNFGNGGTEIGSFTGFYSSLVNGKIPANVAAGSNYKVRVVSSNPAITSAPSNAFTINAVAGYEAVITSTEVLEDATGKQFKDVFGICNPPDGNHQYKFTNQSGNSATATATVFDELDNADAAPMTFTPNANFTAKNTTYTITVKATAGGVIATKCYPLINNLVFTNLGTSGNNTVCQDSGLPLPFFIDFTSQTGIQKNYPGMRYRITYGDGTPAEFYTVRDIIKKDGKLAHTYIKSSCGNNADASHKGVFLVILQNISPYCGNVGSQSPGYAKVVAPAQNYFDPPVTSCVGKVVTFTNLSDPGQEPNSTSGVCENTNALWTWDFGDGTKLEHKKKTDLITHTYASKGSYNITLHLESTNNLCPVDDFIKPICIVEAPKPEFTIATTACTNTAVPATNTSVIDELTCVGKTTTTYLWSVTPAAGVTFNANDKNPSFKFANSGKYTIKLSVTSGCDAISITHDIFIDGPPTAELSPDATFCQLNISIPFTPTANKTKTVITGTAAAESNNYEWSIISKPAGAPDPVFTPNNHTQYPTIKFNGAGTYRVQIKHTNNCNLTPVIKTQDITLRDAPLFDPKATPGLICPDGTAQLDAQIEAGSFTSLKWTSSLTGGTFIGGDNIVNPVYKPSPAEVAAGVAHLTLNVSTSITGCEKLDPKTVDILIQPVNNITSAATKTICTKGNVGYQIVSPVGTSKYTWTIESQSPFITGATESSTGTKTVINDVLVNSNLTEVGTVKYKIIPTNGDCTGAAFFLTVSVTPKIIASFTADNISICGDKSIKFANTSTPISPDVKYLWDFGDNTTSTELSPSHLFKEIGDGSGVDKQYTVTLTVTGPCGPVTAPSQIIIVHPLLPVARIGQPSTGGISCGRVTITVPNLSPGNNNDYLFTLRNSEGTALQEIQKFDKSNVVFSPIDPTKTETYSVSMVASNFCGQQTASTPSPRYIDVAVAGQSDMDISVSQACVGTPVLFKNQSIGATFRYDIYRNGTKFDSRTVTTVGEDAYTFTEPGDYTVSVTAASAGCGDAATSAPRSIKILPLPTATFTPSNVECDNLIYKFTVNGATDPAFTYSWNFGDGSPLSSDPVHTYPAPGNYPVTLTVSNSLGCVGASSTVPVAVAPKLQAAFTVSPGEQINVPNYHFSFSDNSTGNAVRWDWDFGNGSPHATTPNPGYTYPAADLGSHVVTLTVYNNKGCSSVISKTVSIVGTPGTLFMPNAFVPGNSSLEVQTFMAKGKGLKTWRMEIFNKWGQVVWQTTKLGPDGEPAEGWDGMYKGSPAPQGTYLWQASATFINGTEWKGMSYNNSSPKRSGVVNLIR